MNVAVLGMGEMGRALAGRLAGARHRVTIWNRSPGKTDALAARGARVAAALPDAVADVDVVITSLSDDDAVRSVALGPDGIHDSIGSDTVYVEASTISPALSIELADAFGAFAQMPVLGSPDAVTRGAAAYLVGAADDVSDRLTPLFDAFGGQVRRYPRPALAAVAKVTNNLLLLAGVAALAEAFTVARAGGLDDDQIRDLLGDSPLVAPGVRNRFDALLSGDTDGWWTTVLAAKDAALAAGVTAGHPELPVTHAVYAQYRAAADAGFASSDMVAIAQLYR